MVGGAQLNWKQAHSKVRVTRRKLAVGVSRHLGLLQLASDYPDKSPVPVFGGKEREVQQSVLLEDGEPVFQAWSLILVSYKKGM